MKRSPNQPTTMNTTDNRFYREAEAPPTTLSEERLEDHQKLATLHPATRQLVTDFAQALALKLLRSQEKYGYGASWKNLGESWTLEDCQKELVRHVEKGDPLDVAAYCAFLWSKGLPTVLHAAEQMAKVQDENDRLKFSLKAADRAHELLEEQMARHQWQPIESSPLTTKSRLVWCPQYQNIRIVYWDQMDGEWKHFGGLNRPLTETPTHWMPVPPAPEKGGSA